MPSAKPQKKGASPAPADKAANGSSPPTGPALSDRRAKAEADLAAAKQRLDHLTQQVVATGELDVDELADARHELDRAELTLAVVDQAEQRERLARLRAEADQLVAAVFDDKYPKAAARVIELHDKAADALVELATYTEQQQRDLGAAIQRLALIGRDDPDALPPGVNVTRPGASVSVTADDGRRANVHAFNPTGIVYDAIKNTIRDAGLGSPRWFTTSGSNTLNVARLIAGIDTGDDQ